MPLFDCENAKKILADLEKSSGDGQALCNFLTAHADELDLLPPAPPAPLKVVCMLTKHELPATLVALEQHWTGRSYRRALAQDKSVDNPLGYNFEQHAPHVIPHKHMKKHLWCAADCLCLYARCIVAVIRRLLTPNPPGVCSPKSR